MKIGITGGIGSGKTTVCKIFEVLGIPVYYADDRAKQLMVESSTLVHQIKALLGAEAYFEDGALNRAFVAKAVFNNPKQLATLNALVHPVVIADAENWHRLQTTPYTLKEAALLFESRSFRSLDKIITVYAPEKVRLQRVMKRDASTESEVKNRMDKQLSDTDKIQLADYVITNTGESPLIPQIMDIHQSILNTQYLRTKDLVFAR